MLARYGALNGPRVATKLLAVALAVPPIVASNGSRVNAHGTGNYCNPYLPNVDARYFFSGPWQPADIAVAQSAFAEWDGLRNNLGLPIYSSSQQPQANADLNMVLLPGGPSNAPCGFDKINLGVTSLNTIRHEIGHNHGLNHVGPSHDLITGMTASMNGCGSGAAIRTDDLANALYRRSGGRITANGGFENGIGPHWSFDAGAGSPYTLSPNQGFRSLLLNSNSVVSTRVRLVQPPASLRARITYKHGGTAIGKYKFEFRSAQHPSGTTSCNGNNGWAPNNIKWDVGPVVSPWVLRWVKDLPPEAGWTTSDVVLPPPGDPGAPDQQYSFYSGIDVKISVWASNANTLVDNVEVARV